VTKPFKYSISLTISIEFRKRITLSRPEKKIMVSPKAGPETKALERFYPEGKVTWTGAVKAGGMGPGSPEMPAEGKGTLKWIMDGLWVVCDFEQDQYIAGQKAITWKAHWVAGWDFAAQEYRAVAFDSNGRSGLFRGKIKGNKLTWESMSDMTIMGQSIKLRFIQDPTDPKAVIWINERSVNDGPWELVEEYIVKPLK